MPALLDDVNFAFQPLFNLSTSGVVAVEALARPPAESVRDLLRSAADTGQLTPIDFGLATRAVQHAADHKTLLPLHVNLLAVSIGRAHLALQPLLQALRDAGRRPADVVLEINPPFAAVNAAAFARGIETLREVGFRLAIDGVGDGDPPLTLLTDPAIDIIKLDRVVTVGIPTDPRCRATAEALIHLCAHSDTQLIAEGVENADQLAALRGLGVHVAQGNALHPASRRPVVHVSIPPAVGDTVPIEPISLAERRSNDPRVTELMHPATTLPTTATADEVREVLASQPSVNCVVLLDEAERPEWAIDRNRFLLAVTGPYGHALHAKRQAARLADKPRVVPIGASVFYLLEILGGSDRNRTNDDIVVIDAAHRCVGVVRVADLVRAVADTKVEQAAALNPLTRLPGSDAMAREVSRRIHAREIFAVGWLDIDSFKSVNDDFGFAAGDDLIRQIGHYLSDAADIMPSVRVGHVGGDDFLFVTGLDDLVALGGRLIDHRWVVENQLVTVSLAVMVFTAGKVSGYREVSKLLAPLKRQAKSVQGSSWVVGRAGTAHVNVLRNGHGRPMPPQAQSTPEPAPPQYHQPAAAG